LYIGLYCADLNKLHVYREILKTFRRRSKEKGDFDTTVDVVNAEYKKLGPMR